MRYKSVIVNIPGYDYLSGILEVTTGNEQKLIFKLITEVEFSEKTKIAIKNVGKKSAAVVLGTGAGIAKDPMDTLKVTASLAGAMIKKQLNPNAPTYPSPGAKAAADRLWSSIKTNVDNAENRWFSPCVIPTKIVFELDRRLGFEVHMESDQKSLRLLFPQDPKIMRLFFKESAEAKKCYRKLTSISRKTKKQQDL